MKKIIIVLAMAASLAACRKEADLPQTTADLPKGLQGVPKGFKVLTPSDLRASLRQQGMLPAQVDFIVASTKFTIRPEEQGQTAAELNAKLEKALSGNQGNQEETGMASTNPYQTSYPIPSILTASMVQDNFVNSAFTLYPADSTVANYPGFAPIIEVSQAFRYSGDQWYHNQAPGGSTWGYYTHRGASLTYFKSNNGVIANNIAYSTQASFTWNPANTVCYHQLVLYYWTGAAWQLIYAVSNYRDASQISQTTSDITAQWGLAQGLYSVGVAIYANGWNPTGWPAWRTQYVHFIPKW
jgi:hypothetical protein